MFFFASIPFQGSGLVFLVDDTNDSRTLVDLQHDTSALHEINESMLQIGHRGAQSGTHRVHFYSGIWQDVLNDALLADLVEQLLYATRKERIQEQLIDVALDCVVDF